MKTEIKEWIKEFEEREGRPPTNDEKAIQSEFYILNVKETTKERLKRCNHSFYLSRQRKSPLWTSQGINAINAISFLPRLEGVFVLVPYRNEGERYLVLKNLISKTPPYMWRSLSSRTSSWSSSGSRSSRRSLQTTCKNSR